MVRAESACKGLLWVALGIATFASAAADLTLVSVMQPHRGEVVARLGYAGPGALQAGALSMRLGSGVPVAAASVASAPDARMPVSLLLCLDRSGSMGGPSAIAAMQRALRESLLGAGDSPLPFKVAIVAFANGTTPLLGLTSDPAVIAAAVDRLGAETGRDGKTRLYDAVAGGLAMLRPLDGALRRVIVVSDGDDEGSSITQVELIRRATATSIPVDAIGFGQLARSASGSLATMAGATGGSFQVANGGPELGAALGGMVRRAVPPREYDATFRYAASADGRVVDAAALVWRPAAGPVVEVPMAVGVAAAAGDVAQPSPIPGREGPTAPAFMVQLELTLLKVPPLGWLVAALLLAGLAAGLALAWRSRRKRDREPDPAPPGSGRADLPPTRVDPPRPPGRREPRPTLIAHRWPDPGAGRVVAVLRATAGDGRRQKRFEVTGALTRIGSAPGNDLVLDGDEFVSAHHADLRAEAGSLYLVDLGSTNGTELNGQRFKDSTRSLGPGDRFTLGRVVLEVTTPDGSGAQQPAFAQGAR